MVIQALPAVPDNKFSMRLVLVGAVLAVAGILSVILGNDTPLTVLAGPGVFALLAGLCTIIGGCVWASVVWLRANYF